MHAALCCRALRAAPSRQRSPRCILRLSFPMSTSLAGFPGSAPGPMASSVDPFLSHLAAIAHRSSTTAAAAASSSAAQTQTQQTNVNAKGNVVARSSESKEQSMEDEPAHDGGEAASAAGAAAPPAPSAAASASAPLSRGLPFLSTHISDYQRRIESVLAYLQEYRFGRGGTSANTAALAALQRSPHEWQREVQSLEAEWATFKLMEQLRLSEERAREPTLEPCMQERYSQQLIKDRMLSGSSHAQISRAIHIIDWLEELQVFLLRIESSGEVAWRRTLRKMQLSRVGDPQKEWMDPDVELRLKRQGVLHPQAHVLEPQDAEEEQRLLEYVWALLRAGRMSEAIELCRSYNQHWRAASLAGGERTHDAGELQPDGSLFRVGNPHRLLWRHTCRALSSAPGVSPVESSIYGLLGGDLPSALRYSGQHKYEEALYCYLRCMVDEEIDDFIRGEVKEGEGGDDDAVVLKSPQAHLIQRSLAGVLTHLESPLNNLVSQSVRNTATGNPYIRLQKWIMLDEGEQAEQEMVRTIQLHYKPAAVATQQQSSATDAASMQQTVNYTYLFFAFHVYLYLHPRAPHAEPLNGAGVYLCKALLGYLESQPSQHSLVAAYTHYLSPPERVASYVRFLHRIPSLQARQELLAQFALYCPEEERLQVTNKLVKDILKDEGDEATRVGATAQQRRTITAGTVGGGTLDASGGGFGVGVSVGALGGVGAGGGGSLRAVGGVSDLAAGEGGPGVGLSPSDLAKISALDCFDLSGPNGANLSVVEAALEQIDSLYRSFVRGERLAAAKKFTEHLQNKRWDAAVFQAIQRTKLDGNVKLSARWPALYHEYSHWKLYMRCLHWYDAWLTHQSARKDPPVFNPALYSSRAQAEREYNLFSQRLSEHTQSHDKWVEDEQQTVQGLLASSLEMLQMEGGWMTPYVAPAKDAASEAAAGGTAASSSAPSASDAAEMSSLRIQVIPRLVGVLMQVCRESHQDAVALQIADLVAAPAYSLHACFTPEQLRALLQQLRAAYIKVHLQPRGGDNEEASAPLQA